MGNLPKARHLLYIFQIPFFQGSQFGIVSYEIIGDDSAPVYFSVNAITGVVTIATTLASENVDTYQVWTIAFCTCTYHLKEDLYIQYLKGHKR